ncbi:MAG: MBL fold metallo-hydrolase, partial [Clostridiales bacterium]|nr:MBL fold metallo-hydrolase [Clostridiales bacterium]
MKITHIYHSGFCIELEQTILIFDWYTGILPELPEEKQVVVFVSHGHGDHFGDCIWSLKKRFRKLIYVIDSTAAVPPGARDVKTVKPGG